MWIIKKQGNILYPQNLEPEIQVNNVPTSKNFAKITYFSSYFND